MRLEVKKLLFDIYRSAKLAEAFTDGYYFERYLEDPKLQSAVERRLEVVGEAINRLVKVDPQTAARISEYRRIIDFRNLLVHGYDVISHEVVWGVVENKLPELIRTIEQLLKEAKEL